MDMLILLITSNKFELSQSLKAITRVAKWVSISLAILLCKYIGWQGHFEINLYARWWSIYLRKFQFESVLIVEIMKTKIYCVGQNNNCINIQMEVLLPMWFGITMWKVLENTWYNNRYAFWFSY